MLTIVQKLVHADKDVGKDSFESGSYQFEEDDNRIGFFL